MVGCHRHHHPSAPRRAGSTTGIRQTVCQAARALRRRWAAGDAASCRGQATTAAAGSGVGTTGAATHRADSRPAADAVAPSCCRTGPSPGRAARAPGRGIRVGAGEGLGAAAGGHRVPPAHLGADGQLIPLPPADRPAPACADAGLIGGGIPQGPQCSALWASTWVCSTLRWACCWRVPAHLSAAPPRPSRPCRRGIAASSQRLSFQAPGVIAQRSGALPGRIAGRAGTQQLGIGGPLPHRGGEALLGLLPMGRLAQTTAARHPFRPRPAGARPQPDALSPAPRCHLQDPDRGPCRGAAGIPV